VAGHRFHHGLVEQVAHGAHADQDRGLEIVDGLNDAGALTRPAGVIEGLAGRQILGVGLLVVGQAGPAGDHQALGVEHADLLAGHLGGNTLLAKGRHHQIGQADGGRTRPEEEQALVLELAAGELEGVDHARQGHPRRSLDAVVVTAHLHGLPMEYWLPTANCQPPMPSPYWPISQ